jgi:predicted enzyme involved in methoxymalonyl-ACP biosynthesis
MVEELLQAALGDAEDYEQEQEQEKTASEGASVPELLKEAASRLEKLASIPALKSFEAAKSATPASVDARNAKVSELKHSPKSCGTEYLQSLSLAKHGSEEETFDMSATDRIRDALITKLREQDMEAQA